MSKQKILEDMITEFEDMIHDNVYSFQEPPEIAKLSKENAKKVLEHLKMALNTIRDTQVKLLNKCREICSYEQHDKVYEDMLDFTKSLVDGNEPQHLNTDEYNWAMAYIATHELFETLKRIDPSVSDLSDIK